VQEGSCDRSRLRYRSIQIDYRAQELRRRWTTWSIDRHQAIPMLPILSASISDRRVGGSRTIEKGTLGGPEGFRSLSAANRTLTSRRVANFAKLSDGRDGEETGLTLARSVARRSRQWSRPIASGIARHVLDVEGRIVPTERLTSERVVGRAYRRSERCCSSYMMNNML